MCGRILRDRLVGYRFRGCAEQRTSPTGDKPHRPSCEGPGRSHQPRCGGYEADSIAWLRRLENAAPAVKAAPLPAWVWGGRRGRGTRIRRPLWGSRERRSSPRKSAWSGEVIWISQAPALSQEESGGHSGDLCRLQNPWAFLSDTRIPVGLVRPVRCGCLSDFGLSASADWCGPRNQQTYGPHRLRRNRLARHRRCQTRYLECV